MTDVTGTNLREPDHIDWDNHNPGSRYVPPPPAQDANGNAIVYTATLPRNMGAQERLGVNDEGYRTYEFGPLTLEAVGGRSAEIRFFTQSVKRFTNRKTQEPMNVSGVSKVLRAAGIAAKPQTTADYDRAVGQTGGRKIQITIDWQAKNRDTGEEIRGYENFPDDPDRPGQKKAILRLGDDLPNGTKVKSEVLFANARVRYVVDSSRK